MRSTHQRESRDRRCKTLGFYIALFERFVILNTSQAPGRHYIPILLWNLTKR